MQTKTNVYVDGFNLYYGCVKGTPYKWLDVGKLCRMLLPGHEIHRIRYFTALVVPRPDDPQQRTRQETFLRALRTISNLSIHYGQFRTHRVRVPLADPPENGPRTIEILDTKEKGSDVNLATYILLDGFRRDYELAVVVSNDADLAEPIRVATRELKLAVGILNPHCRQLIHELRGITGFYRPIREGALKACQFPDVLRDAHGEIHKPSGW